MAFLPGFENDFFISYSHVDNLSVGDEVHWVKRFHESLEVSLAQRVGRVGIVKIWRDERVDGNQLFDVTIKSAIERSAFFLSLTSNGYLASDYCMKELSWFAECAEKSPCGLQIGDRYRISNLLLNNIPHDHWPPAFGRVSGFVFHDSRSTDELGFPLAPSDREFLKQLRALSDSLYESLIEFKELHEGRTAGHRPADDGVRNSASMVFMADVPDSLRSTRKRIIQELTRKGVRVESGIPPPYAASEHDESVKEILASSQLSVHLMDQLPGREIDGGDGTTYPQRQITLAGDVGGSHLVWVPKGLALDSIEDDRHRALLDELENGQRRERPYEFVRGESAPLSSQILEKLKEFRASSEQVADGRAVLLDTHIKDQLHAYPVGQYFLQNGIQPFINPQEDDPSRNLDILEARLRSVSALVVLYGQVSEQWVRQRLGAALQLSVVKGFPIKSFCVYSIPPEKDQSSPDFRIGPLAVQLIDNSHSDRFNPDLFGPVLHGFSAGGAS